jgi:hypothetical protein
LKDEFPRTSLSRQDTAYCFAEDIFNHHVNVPSFVCSTFSPLSFRNFSPKTGKKEKHVKVLLSRKQYDRNKNNKEPFEEKV